MRLAAIVLAAGAATRYRAGGGDEATKLVAFFEGEPMVRRAVRAALEGGADPVIVVTGHAREAIEAALAGCAVRFVHNAGFAAGLSTSLRTGLDALPGDVEAAAILLGDMPLVTGATIARLCAAAAADPSAQAIVPTVDGVRGNPVLLRQNLFAAASRLTGDEGARRLLRDSTLRVLDVPMEGEATRFDIDDAGRI